MEHLEPRREGSARITGSHRNATSSGLSISNLAVGAFAGCIATGPMTALMTVLHRYLPGYERYPLPPSQITTRVLEEGGLGTHLPEPEHKLLTMLSHFAYGAVGGALFAPLSRSIPFAPFIRGAAFGLLVWAVSYLGWLPALGVLPPATHHPARRNALMITAHIVWGGVTGMLIDTLGRE